MMLRLIFWGVSFSASLCQNPGVPMGGQRVGRRFEEGDRVRYTCYKSLVLLGSVYRTCLEDGSWSGLEPRCEDPHSYDEPETVAKHLKFSEEILLNPDKEIHIYFVIKASSSVGTENLKKALLFVDNLSGMVMASSGQVKCSLVLFGSSAREMVPLTSNQVAMEMEDTDNVTDFLEQPGVNTGEALTVVLQSVRRNPTGKQIVILVTDGRVWQRAEAGGLSEKRGTQGQLAGVSVQKCLHIGVHVCQHCILGLPFES
uniref:Sushi domain-containing protein n=1 Tax=Lepisosteus oculatus TaxID=7918 RepID=W5LW77_LEPOC